MIIDLTQPVYSGMPVYPGDPNSSLNQACSHEKDGFSVHTMVFGSHTGTHIDAPSHYFIDAPAVDTQPVLEACIGFARVFDISHLPPGKEIMPGDIGIHPDSISRGERILLASGWSKRFGEDGFFERFPCVSEELAELLIDRKIALLGVETPSPHLGKSDTIHKMLLSSGVIIVENLANLDKIEGERIFFSAAPLRLQGIDGSPVRAYAIV